MYALLKKVKERTKASKWRKKDTNERTNQQRQRNKIPKMIYGWRQAFALVLLWLPNWRWIHCFSVYTVSLAILKYLLLMPACGVSVLSWHLRQFSQTTEEIERRKNPPTPFGLCSQNRCWHYLKCCWCYVLLQYTLVWPFLSICGHVHVFAGEIQFIHICFVNKKDARTNAQDLKIAFEEDNNAHIYVIS